MRDIYENYVICSRRFLIYRRYCDSDIFVLSIFPLLYDAVVGCMAINVHILIVSWQVRAAQNGLCSALLGSQNVCKGHCYFKQKQNSGCFF